MCSVIREVHEIPDLFSANTTGSAPRTVILSLSKDPHYPSSSLAIVEQKQRFDRSDFIETRDSRLRSELTMSGSWPELDSAFSELPGIAVDGRNAVDG